MGATRIEWANVVWNPTTGCSPVSEGCQNCYARRFARRLRGRYGYPDEEPFQVVLHPERLEQPRHWRKPRRVFVCSMGDLFHPDVPGWYINQVWLSMMNNSQHTYLVLTKRPERLLAWTRAAARAKAWPADEVWPWWIWVGVTAENQARADERIPILAQIPAAVRWVSCEPLLGPIDLTEYLRLAGDDQYHVSPVRPALDWVVVGAETGPGARLCNPEWVRSLRDQCWDENVPFFFKRWRDGSRLLDGREWNEMPSGVSGGDTP